MNGFLIIDKPVGVTSFSMVAMVRRLTGIRRVGHAGTLDPLASGVLPVAVGYATRFIEYLDDAPKVYVARVRFGIQTDSYDAEGQIVAEADASRLAAVDVEAALPAFVGEISQVPPRFSALKVEGKPLYRYAREGAAIEAAPRVVRIDRIDLLRFEAGEAEVEVECGRGTYIRSLAHDLGRALGAGAHLAALRRNATGGFTLADAHAPGALTEAAAAGALEDLLLHADRAVERRPAVIVGPDRARLIATGTELGFGTDSEAAICRAYDADGSFLGVLANRGPGRWRAAKVVQSG